MGWQIISVDVKEDIEVQQRPVPKGRYEGLAFTRRHVNSDGNGETSYWVTLGTYSKSDTIEDRQVTSWRVDDFIARGLVEV